MVKPIKKTMRIFGALLLLCVGAGALWLQSGTHQLPWAKEMLLKKLNAGQESYHVTIDDVVMDWRDITRVGSVTMTGLVISDAQGDAFAKLPEIDLEVNIWGALIGENVMDRVVVQRPRIYMSREESGSILLGIDENRATLSLEELFSHLSGNQESAVGKLPFKALEIRNAHFQLRQAAGDGVLKSQRFSANLARDGKAYRLQFSLPLKDGETNSLLEGGARRISDKDGWALNMRFESLPSRWVCDVLVCPKGQKYAGYSSGKITAESDAQMRVLQLSGTIGGANISAEMPSMFAEPLLFDEVQLAFTLKDGLKHAVVDKLQLSLPEGSTLLAALDMRQTDGQGVVGVLQANMDSLPVEALRKYWPHHLSAESRQWVLDNLTGGTATKSEIVLSLSPGDTLKEHLPDDALHATIHTNNMNIRFLPDLPAAVAPSAMVYFTGKSMQVEAKKATALNSVALTDVALLAEDLNHPNVPMEVSFLVAASAPDAATVLKSPYFTFDDVADLNPKTISGSMQGDIDLRFDSYTGNTSNPDEVDLSSVRYDINVALADVSQPKLVGGMDVQALHAELAVSNNEFVVHGDTMLSAQAVHFSAIQHDEKPMELKFTGELAREEFAAMGLPDTPYVTAGTVRAEVNAIHGNAGLALRNASFDLSDAETAIPEISWQKPAGEAGNVTIQQAQDGYAVDVVMKNLYAKGSLAFEGELGTAVKRADFSSIKSNQNDFSLTYTKEETGFAVDLKGKRLDASGGYDDNDNSLLEDFPAIRLNIDLGELALAEGALLKDIKGYLNCDAKRCHAASINGKADNAVFAGRIYEEEGQRKLSIQADDGGDLLSALNITDRVFDGKLSLKGTYDDEMSPPVFKGRLLLTDYLVKNSQIFARLFTIGSLSGLANALNDTGIEFEKLSMNVEAAGGKILIKDGKASGNATGFTTEGLVDTTNAEIHLKGVLVPAFFINSLVNNIPLIGELAGGDGEGVVAFRYTVDGNYGKEPEVTVNPLSGFTPGFLRGFFDIFDKPVPKELDVEPSEN